MKRRSTKKMFPNARRRVTYPRTWFERVGPNRYILNTPSSHFDLDRVPAGWTYNASGYFSKRRKRRRILHRRSR